MPEAEVPNHERTKESERHARVEVGDFETAYQIAAKGAADWPHEVHFPRMMGLNARLLAGHLIRSDGSLDEAEIWAERASRALNVALLNATEHYDSGNVRRDAAASIMMKARIMRLKGLDDVLVRNVLDDAELNLEMADEDLQKVSPKDWQAIAVTRSYMGQLEIARGRAESALFWLEMADDALCLATY